MIEITDREQTLIIGLIVSIAGSILIITTIGWLPWLGMILMGWGNNINLKDDFNKVFKKILRIIQKL